MGGSSKSKQETTNEQTSNNYANNGEFAGASNVSFDESDNSIEDSYNTDNSVEDSYNTDNSQEWDIETDISIETDIDNSQDNRIEDSFNTDNSQEWEVDNSQEWEVDSSQDNRVEDSNNTDNSIENDGEFSGNNGSIVFSDENALKAAENISGKALSVASDALAANEKIMGKAFDFGESALDEMQTVAVSAMTNTKEFGTSVIEELTEQADSFSDSLAEVTKSNMASNQSALLNISDRSSEDKAIIAELARNTALGGQDIVAKSSEKMVMYMAGALIVGFVAMLVMRGGD